MWAEVAAPVVALNVAQNPMLRRRSSPILAQAIHYAGLFDLTRKSIQVFQQYLPKADIRRRYTISRSSRICERFSIRGDAPFFRWMNVNHFTALLWSRP